MLASEDKRLALRNRLIEILGEEEARTLMDSLPPIPWERIALKDDVVASEERIRTEMNGKFTQVEGEFAKVYAELKGMRAETTAEFKTLRSENKEFRGEMALQFAKQTRTMVFTMLALAVPTWASILAVGLA